MRIASSRAVGSRCCSLLGNTWSVRGVIGCFKTLHPEKPCSERRIVDTHADTICCFMFPLSRVIHQTYFSLQSELDAHQLLETLAQTPLLQHIAIASASCGRQKARSSDNQFHWKGTSAPLAPKKIQQPASPPFSQPGATSNQPAEQPAH